MPPKTRLFDFGVGKSWNNKFALLSNKTTGDDDELLPKSLNITKPGVRAFAADRVERVL